MRNCAGSFLSGKGLELEAEVPSPSDSDHESDYLTGLEDFMDHTGVPQTENERILKTGSPVTPPYCIGDISQTSSFIQKILYEDARSGVAVVDMFVAVKSVKDNLDFLARCNNEVFEKINHLNKEVKTFRQQYGDLLLNMESFLAKMNEDTKILEIRESPERAQSETESNVEGKPKAEGVAEETNAEDDKKRQSSEGSRPEPQTETRQGANRGEELENQRCRRKDSRSTCSECGSSGRKKSKVCCLGCFMSAFKEKSFGGHPALSEALVGSFLASLIWLQRGRGNSQTSSRSSSPTVDETKAEDLLNLNNTTVQMICDVCEAVSGAASDCAKTSKESRELRGLSTHRTDLKSKSPSNDVSCLYCGQNSFAKDFVGKTKSEDSLKFEYEMTSEAESDFEGALASPSMLSKHYDLKAKPSVTCMGDLTKARPAKTNANATSSVPSWIEKLSAEITSKLRKGNSTAKIRISQEPCEKLDKCSDKFGGSLELPIRANTPMGVFNVTVVQHKKSRHFKNRFLKRKANPLGTCPGPTPVHDSQTVSGMAFSKEDMSSWSEESLHNTDSCVTSNSGESDLEEFIEIFPENSKGSNNSETLINPYEGCLRAIELKLGKAHFFQIEKRQPTYVAQEFFQKKSKDEEKAWEKCRKEVGDVSFLCLGSGEKREQQVVIEGSSSDLVIYIQVEVEGNQSPKPEGIVCEYQTNSLGTQTTEDIQEKFPVPEEKVIKLEEKTFDGVSLYQIWKVCDGENEGGSEEEAGVKEEESSIASIADDGQQEQALSVIEPKEKTVIFKGKQSESFIERELLETHLENQVNQSNVRNIDVKDEKQRADVWYLQSNSLMLLKGEVKTPVSKDVIDKNPLELEKALELIHEIENDVVDVKLSDAILILPRLETELRKHLQDKMKSLGEKELKGANSLQNFFSTVDLWPEEEPVEDNSCTSEDRLNNLLSMLSNLEEAVKSSEHSSDRLCPYDSSKIYTLLHELSASILGLEEGPNVTSLSQTMEIASQLDTAVREYDSMVKRQPAHGVSSECKSRRNSDSLEEMCVMQHLKNVRKKVFEMVEVEATDVEGRIEKDFDRLDRLEGENDEALMFLEAFLQKTEKRMTELSNLKAELKELSLSLNDLYESLKDAVTRKAEKETEIVQIKKPKEQNCEDSSVDSMCLSTPPEKEALRETVSGLLLALDNLKSRAKEKKEACKEILHPGTLEKVQEPENSSQRSSRSSFTTKHSDKLYSTVEEFRKIGQSSLYIAWTQPEGRFKSSIVGYQIHVNEKLNQKVRNPQRLQAVLYSVDLTRRANIQLYAVVENGQKMLLTTVSYLEERTSPPESRENPQEN